MHVGESHASHMMKVPLPEEALPELISSATCSGDVGCGRGKEDTQELEGGESEGVGHGVWQRVPVLLYETIYTVGHLMIM